MVEAVGSSYWKWLMGHHLDDGRGALRGVLAEEPSLWAAVPDRGEQQWSYYWGMGQLENTRECLTYAVTQTISSISSNPQGCHFSCPFLLDCFWHHKSRCSGFGREEAIALKSCSALQNNIQLGCGPEELQHFRDSLGPCVQCTKKWYTDYHNCWSLLLWSPYVPNFMLTLAGLKSFLLA